MTNTARPTATSEWLAEPADQDACLDCGALATVDDYCATCAKQHGYRECEWCGTLADVLVDVQTLRQTWSSPAEYAEVCCACLHDQDYRNRPREDRPDFPY